MPKYSIEVQKRCKLDTDCYEEDEEQDVKDRTCCAYYKLVAQNKTSRPDFTFYL